MNKYYIDYTTQDGDLSHIWVTANDEAEAEAIARSEYWDIYSIIDIRKA